MDILMLSIGHFLSKELEYIQVQVEWLWECLSVCALGGFWKCVCWGDKHKALACGRREKALVCYGVNRLFVHWDWKTVSHYDKLRLQYTIVYLNLHTHTHTHIHSHATAHTQIPELDRMSFNLPPLFFFSAVMTNLSVFPLTFSSLLTHFLSPCLYIHPSPPSLFIPPTVGVSVMEQQKLFPCFFFF